MRFPSTQGKPAAFRLTAARLFLLKQPLAAALGQLATALELVENRNIPTMNTNGKVIGYNPDFVTELDDAQLVTLIAHETAHVALGHPLRFKPATQDHDTANIAMDHAANILLTHCGLAPVSRWYCDMAYDRLSWEQIYTILNQQKAQENPPPPPPQDSADDEQSDDAEQDDEQSDDADAPAEAPQDADEPADEDGQGEGEESPADADPSPGEGESEGEQESPAAPAPGKPGDLGGNVQPYPAESDADRAAAERELSQTILTIDAAAQQAGISLGDAMTRLIKQLTAPRQPDLYEALSQLLERTAADHSYRRPNRRLLHAGIFPGLDGEECPPLVVVVDTSGSITDAILNQFSDILARAVQDFRPRAVTVIYCDDAINGDPETFAPDEMPRLSPCGGGCTDFRPPFAWVAENMDEQPAALVYLTDLEGPFPATAPDFPVIWAAIPTTYPRTPTFGDVVPVTLA